MLVIWWAYARRAYSRKFTVAAQLLSNVIFTLIKITLNGMHTTIYTYSITISWQEVALFAFLKPLFHSSQKPTRKLAARTFIQSQYLKVLVASLRVGFCDKWKRGFRPA